MTAVPVFRLPAFLWPAIADALLKAGAPWSDEAANADLRWWTTSGSIPSIEALRRRWSWTRDRVRELVRSRAWHDRSLPPPARATAWPKTTNRQGANGQTPTKARSSASKGGR